MGKTDALLVLRMSSGAQVFVNDRELALQLIMALSVSAGEVSWDRKPLDTKDPEEHREAAVAAACAESYESVGGQERGSLPESYQQLHASVMKQEVQQGGDSANMNCDAPDDVTTCLLPLLGQERGSLPESHQQLHANVMKQKVQQGGDSVNTNCGAPDEVTPLGARQQTVGTRDSQSLLGQERGSLPESHQQLLSKVLKQKVQQEGDSVNTNCGAPDEVTPLGAGQQTVGTRDGNFEETKAMLFEKLDELSSTGDSVAWRAKEHSIRDEEIATVTGTIANYRKVAQTPGDKTEDWLYDNFEATKAMSIEKLDDSKSSENSVVWRASEHSIRDEGIAAVSGTIANDRKVAQTPGDHTVLNGKGLDMDSMSRTVEMRVEEILKSKLRDFELAQQEKMSKFKQMKLEMKLEKGDQLVGLKNQFRVKASITMWRKVVEIERRHRKETARRKR